MARREAAQVVTAFKGMEAVRSVTNQRWVVLKPGLRSITPTNIAQTDTELIRYNQANGMRQIMPSATATTLPKFAATPAPSGSAATKSGVPAGVSEPVKNLRLVQMMAIDEEGCGSIQSRNNRPAPHPDIWRGRSSCGAPNFASLKIASSLKC